MTQADELVSSVLSASQREHVDPAGLRELREAFVRLEEAHEDWLAEDDELGARRKAELCITARHALFDVINRVTMSEQIAGLFATEGIL